MRNKKPREPSNKVSWVSLMDLYQNREMIHSISPTAADAANPNTKTGPAMEKSFTQVPVTIPSACVKIGTREIFALFYWVFGSSNF